MPALRASVTSSPEVPWSASAISTPCATSDTAPHPPPAHEIHPRGDAEVIRVCTSRGAAVRHLSQPDGPGRRGSPSPRSLGRHACDARAVRARAPTAPRCENGLAAAIASASTPLVSWSDPVRRRWDSLCEQFALNGRCQEREGHVLHDRARDACVGPPHEELHRRMRSEELPPRADPHHAGGKGRVRSVEHAQGRYFECLGEGRPIAPAPPLHAPAPTGGRKRRTVTPSRFTAGGNRRPASWVSSSTCAPQRTSAMAS